MLGFVSALGAELATGKGVLSQLDGNIAPIAATFVLFSVASLVPILKGAKMEAFGPLTPKVRARPAESPGAPSLQHAAAPPPIHPSLLPHRPHPLLPPPSPPQAEALNGQVAMIGFAFLLLIEAINNGTALF